MQNRRFFRYSNSFVEIFQIISSFFSFFNLYIRFYKCFCQLSRIRHHDRCKKPWTFFAKPIDFSFDLCYTIMRACNGTFSCLGEALKWIASLTISYFYGEVLKWGRLRALPVAEQASNKEWQPSQSASKRICEVRCGNGNRIEEATPIR